MALDLKALYDASPIAIQNVMVSVQGWQFAYRRWDPAFVRDLVEQLLESQWWPANQFRAYQNEKLHAHVRFAGERIPYYRFLFRREGIDPNQIRTCDDLKRIPILEKAVVRQRPEQFLVDGRPHKGWRKGHTSGTTGAPLDVYTTRESFSQHWSFICRLRAWGGLPDPIFPRRVQFSGRDIVPMRQPAGRKVFWRHNIPGKALVCSTAHLTLENAPHYVKAIREFRPEVFEGYPSAMLFIGRVGRSLNLDLPRPIAILPTAETLFPEWRDELEDLYQCSIHNQYASSDMSSFWSSCEHGVLHKNPEYGISEIVRSDGSAVEPGEEGDVVATAFVKREQVLIRYRIGDRAIRGTDDLCACGRQMPRVEQVTGRVEDMLYIPGRGYVRAWANAFKLVTDVLEMQVVHESLDRLRVRVATQPGWGARTRANLESVLRLKVGDDIALEIEEVDAIPRGANGKFRPVVSLCQDQYPDTM